jgi:RimJ/RimL family protein N-acetyltransferase
LDELLEFAGIPLLNSKPELGGYVDIQFRPVEFSELLPTVQQHLAGLHPIDSFLEVHILESQHYLIEIAGSIAGFASIHQSNLVTQFSLTDEFKRFGQLAFFRLRKLEKVQAAFVPTFDEFFLAHALDDFRQINKQAYFFLAPSNHSQQSLPQSCSLQLATPNDIDFVKQESADFFENIAGHIEAHELFITTRDAIRVGFGMMLNSTLNPALTSIGVFTIERFRGSGIGTTTIGLLIEACQRQKWQAVAGCWYYNHASKRTLERAGMFTQTRLLKIEF